MMMWLGIILVSAIALVAVVGLPWEMLRFRLPFETRED